MLDIIKHTICPNRSLGSIPAGSLPGDSGTEIPSALWFHRPFKFSAFS